MKSCLVQLYRIFINQIPVFQLNDFILSLYKTITVVLIYVIQ